MLALLCTLTLSRECRTITRCPHRRRVCPEDKKLEITICGAKVRTYDEPEVEEEMNLIRRRPHRNTILPEEHDPRVFKKVIDGVECIKHGVRGHWICPRVQQKLEENGSSGGVNCRYEKGKWKCDFDISF